MNLLEGLRILVLEDEFLIAMDVEQLCRDHGAADVVIVGSLEEGSAQAETLHGFDAAVIDVMLGGASTLPFAAKLDAKGVPFVFATGYADSQDIRKRFPGVAIIGKPYSGDDLIAAVAAARQRRAG